ncbi:hypothetical protein SLEP1_g8489 [Rubroshorea leprosula]|uniref:BZIP domain-containing protein n=1 Tax=Rubroshorea leprosula TaxID=152421 RepID=A0AAV5IA62_9ROSI|nr:hypothetical protein SLEP1_g8489 [Rubroshorea leprosula]
MEEEEIKELHTLSQANPLQNLLPFCSSQETHPTATHLNMQPDEVSGTLSLPHEYSAQNPDTSTKFANRLLLNSQFHVPFHILSPNMSCLSTEEEGREYQLSIDKDKRLRRIISNRESARRSRLRKKKQIEELQSQVHQLQTINHQLGQELIHLLENNHRILQENAQLKENVSTLHLVLADMFSTLNNLEDITGNSNQQLRAEATNQSTLS